MKCSFVDENFERYMEGELAKSEEREIALHIKSCERCHKKYYDDFVLKNLLGGIEDEPIPKGLADKTYDYIFGTESKKADNVLEFRPKKKKKGIIPAITGGIAAAVIVMAVIISPNIISGAGGSNFTSSLGFSSSTESSTETQNDETSNASFDAAADEGQSSQGTLEDSADVDLSDSEDSAVAPQTMEDAESYSSKMVTGSWYTGYDINVTSDAVELFIYDEDIVSRLEGALSSRGISSNAEDEIYTADCGDGETLQNVLSEAGISDDFKEATIIRYVKGY